MADQIIDIWSGFVVWDVLPKKADLFARVDNVGGDLDGVETGLPGADTIDYLLLSPNSPFTTWTIGGEWYLTPSIRVGPNAELVNYENDPDPVNFPGGTRSGSTGSPSSGRSSWGVCRPTSLPAHSAIDFQGLRSGGTREPQERDTAEKGDRPGDRRNRNGLAFRRGCFDPTYIQDRRLAVEAKAAIEQGNDAENYKRNSEEFHLTFPFRPEDPPRNRRVRGHYSRTATVWLIVNVSKIPGLSTT